MSSSIRLSALVVLGCVASATVPAHAQTNPPQRGAETTITIAPGPEYGTSGFARTLLGNNWRDLWSTPVAMPLFDFDTYAGGVKFKKRGGGMQSRVLHLDAKDGWQEYRFRSLNKFPSYGMTSTLKGTIVGNIIQDQVSSLFPGAPVLVPPLLNAIGALHVTPELYVMADDERLGEHRKEFARLPGTAELKGSEGPDGSPGFGGSKKIIESEDLIEELQKSREHTVDEREFLAVRLVDFLINDPDRTYDNFDWARFGEKGAYRWRVLARDRDYAFMDARGPINALIVRGFYPKIIPFNEKYPLKGLTYATFPLDRRLLQRLTREDFAAVAQRVQSSITDAVLEDVISRLPAEWREQTTVATRLRGLLHARRNGLVAVADQFYLQLAGETDIHGTDEAEQAEIVKHADGRVTVTIGGREAEPVVASSDSARTGVSFGSVARPPFYQRTFLPGETREVRLYLADGNDRAIVRGTGSDIIVRVIGGSGDDVLADSTGTGDKVHFYDEKGDKRFLTAANTGVSETPWMITEAPQGLRFGHSWRPDWGSTSGFVPLVSYGEGAGVILGAGYAITSYGFRRLPHHWRAGASVHIGTGNGRMAVAAHGNYRMENSPMSASIVARASKLDAFRFYGYGNQAARVDRSLSIVERTVVSMEPALSWDIGWRARERDVKRLMGEEPVIGGLQPTIGAIEVGPVFYWSDTDPRAGSPFETVIGNHDAFTRVGARLGLWLDRTDREATPMRGYTVRSNVAGYPSILGLTKSFSTASLVATGYVPFSSDGPHMAVRIGGSAASTGAPVEHAPSVGGSSTLRGYAWQRFSGDRAVDASTELRIPMGTMNFLVRSKVGVFGLADAGRVWHGGASPGGWHTAFGGGVWASAFGKAISIAYARGEENRIYARSGLAF